MAAGYGTMTGVALMAMRLPPARGVRVFSPETAAQMRRMLQLAAGPGGTAPPAWRAQRHPGDRRQTMKFSHQVLATATLAVLGLNAAVAQAQIKVGVTVSATGPAASLGIPEKNTIDLLPKTIAGQKVNYIVLDDTTDTTTAVKNTRKLISENRVDVIIGSTTTPNSLDPADTLACTIVATNVVTADPTLTANAFLYQAALNQRATFRWVAQPYGEILIPATASNGIMIGPRTSIGNAK